MTALTLQAARNDIKLSKDIIDGEFEVEQLLNEIGVFSEEYMLPESQSAFKEYVPTSKADDIVHTLPHYDDSSVSVDDGEISALINDPVADNVTSISIEKMEKFSVPNPMAFSVPNPILYTESSDEAQENTHVEIAPKKVVVKDEHPSLQKVEIADQSTVSAEKKISVINKKRKLEPSPVREPSSPVSVTATLDSKELTEEQMEERRVRNREHAKRSRLRKKSLTQTLQQSLDQLKAENSKIKEMLHEKLGYETAQTIIEERQSRPLNQFLEALAQPTNRVLDNQTLSFLKSLKKKVPKQSK